LIISSRKDDKWAMRLRTAVSQLAAKGSVAMLDDSKLGSDQGRAELADGLATASVAAVLVSEDMLGSAFVLKVELAALLEAAQQQGLRVCRLPVTHCLDEVSGLAQFPSIHDVKRPLDSLNVMRRDAVMTEIAQRIYGVSRGSGVQVDQIAVSKTADAGKTSARSGQARALQASCPRRFTLPVSKT